MTASLWVLGVVALLLSLFGWHVSRMQDTDGNVGAGLVILGCWLTAAVLWVVWLVLGGIQLWRPL